MRRKRRIEDFIRIRKNGIQELYDNIAADNSAIALFLKCGFEEECRTDEIIMLKKKLME